MKQMSRERRTVWVSTFESKEPVTDSEGRLTGEWAIARKPVAMRPTVSPASGGLESYGFGIGADYDRTLVFNSTDTGIDEGAVFWVDCGAPELADDGTLAVDADTGDFKTPWDYVAARPPAVSANYTNVAVRRADR